MSPIRRSAVLAGVALAVAVGGAAPAAAQNDFNYNVPDLTTPGVSASLLDLNRPATGSSGSSGSSGSTRKPKQPAKPRKPTRAQLRTLRYKPLAARERQVDAQLNAAWKAASPPEMHAALDERFGQGGYRPVLNEVLGALGGSTRDFGDRLGATLVVAWVTHSHDRKPSPDGTPTPLRFTSAQVRGGRAFLKQVRNALALEPRIRRLSDARKQRVADTVGLSVMHVDSAVREFSDADQRMTAARMQDGLNAAMRKAFGVDLRRIKLTSKGFERD